MTQAPSDLLEDPVSFQAHDLVWLKAGALDRQREWACALPDWALSELDRDTPLIVRRALATPGVIPVGIRGRRRSQRQATYLPITEVGRRVNPPLLRVCSARADRAFLPPLKAWEQLKSRASIVAYPWGPTGSCAYELATQCDWVTEGSDLDLVVSIDAPISRRQANDLLSAFYSDACRTDVQVMTPRGGMALVEWAGGSERVLLKTIHGPVLTDSPWDIEEQP